VQDSQRVRGRYLHVVMKCGRPAIHFLDSRAGLL
jgi:hypothetical protein